jgi:hypothetical protein
MRILIQNYSSDFSTEPAYLNQCLIQCGVESFLWSDVNASAFDMFDSTHPDIFIGHYRFLTNDIIKYISQNKKIQLILNVTGANEQEMQSIEQVYDQNNIKTPFVFTNLYDFMHSLKPKNLKLVNILPAADIFLPPIPTPNFEMDLAIVSSGDNEIINTVTKDRNMYHLLSLGRENANFDLPINIRSITGLSDRYKEIMLIDDVSVVSSQILFETSLKAKKVSVRVNSQQQPLLDKVLAMLFHANVEEQDLGSLVKDQIKRKHTCFNRAARLMRLLKDEETTRKLQTISEQL